MNPIFLAQIKHGHLEFFSKEKFSVHLNSFWHNTVVEVVVKEPGENNPRSSSQNKYYWAVPVKLISLETGYTPNETHEILKHLFLCVPLKIKNKVVFIARSTTELSTMEMEDYLTSIREWASIELSCYIPLPNEVEGYAYTIDDEKRDKNA